MQVLIIGARGWEPVDKNAQAFRAAFASLGHEVCDLGHRDLLRSWSVGPWGRLRTAWLGRADVWPAAWVAKADAAVLALARRAQPALVLTLKGETLTPGLLESLKALPSRPALVDVFPDNPFNYPPVMPTVACYDRFYVKDSFVVARLRAVGLGCARYLPHGCDPSVHHPLGRPLSPSERESFVCDVGLAGTIYTERLAVLRALEHLDVRIWGHAIAAPWERDPWVRARHRGGGLLGEGLRLLAAGARISLNSHHPVNDVFGVNDRTHEVAGCGGVQLVDDRPDLAALYEPGRELLVYRDLAELREQAARLLSDEPLRERLRVAAVRRAHGEHSFLARARAIIADLGL